MSKFVREMLLWTVGSILVCSAIGAMVGFPGIGFAIGCVLVVGVYALMRLFAWMFVMGIIGIFDSISGRTRR